MKRTTNDRPLLKRLKLSSRPSITLSQKQLSAIADFRRAVSTGNYKFTPNPCLCGSASDILVASRDRYGLNVTTKLCNSCGLLRTDPYFDSQSLVHFYDDHYRNIYLNKSQDASFLFEKEFQHGKDIVSWITEQGLTLRGSVYEIGCGAGGILQAFHEQGLYTVGCDLGSELLQYGRQRGLNIEHGDISSLKAYAPADLLVMSHVVEHFPDPIAKLKEVKHLLTPEGYIYVEVPGLFWLKRSYGADFGRYLQNAHVYHYCLESLDYVMSLAGFSRFAGNECIKAIYYQDNVKTMSPVNLPEREIEFLKNLEQFRLKRTYLSLVQRPILKLYSYALALGNIYRTRLGTRIK